VVAVSLGIAPQPGRDPVARFVLADVSPPVVRADTPAYQPITDRLEQVGFFAVIAQSALPALAGLADPTDSAIDNRAARDMTGVHGNPPQLDLPPPEGDKTFRSVEASRPPTVPHLGQVDGTLPMIGAGLSIGLSAVARSGAGTGPRGPEHYLQSGYFADRENAVGLSRNLANAGLDVLMEQTTSRTGKTRWRVLVGPYRQKEDALSARSRAPDLLAEAFYQMRGN
jgi:hypothetical protein